MKRMTKILLSSAVMLTAAVALNAQVTITQSQYIEESMPMNLKAHKGEVAVAFDMEIGDKFIKRDQLCVITPMFVNGAYQQSLPPIIVEGKKYAYLSKEQKRSFGTDLPNHVKDYYQIVEYDYNKKKPFKVHYQAKTNYVPQMKGSVLVLNYKTYLICGDLVSENNTYLAHGVTDYTNFIERNPVVYYTPNRVGKQYVNDFSNRSVFKSGRTTIDWDAFMNYGYKALKNEVEKLQANKDVVINKMQVHTAASPEGPLSLNKKLAAKRADVIADYISKDLGIPVSVIEKQWVDENWDAFAQELPTTALANKNEIMDIITSTDNWDEREKKLRKLSNWKEIYDVFQELRNCLVVIDYTTREYYGDEVVISGKDIAVVNLGNDVKVTSLEKTIFYYNEDPKSVANLNNMMVALMEQGRYAEAEEYAERIHNYNIPPMIANNKGVLYMYLNEPRKAQTMFELAEGIPMSNYNHGLMLLVDEQYAPSADMLNSFNSVNSVVANLGADRNAAAARNTHMSVPTGEVYYLCAIAYANDGLEDLALGALAKAVKYDPSYKIEALNQAEFVGYRTNAKFIEITK